MDCSIKEPTCRFLFVYSLVTFVDLIKVIRKEINTASECERFYLRPKSLNIRFEISLDEKSTAIECRCILS